MSPQSEPDFMSMERSVPLFSASGAGESFLITGILWALLFRIIQYTVGLRVDIAAWVILTLAFGGVIYTSWDVLKRRRFRNPVTNQDLLQLFEEVKRDLGRGERVELWYRDIDRQVFLSTSNLLFRAILLSESAIADFIDKREKGRVLLAREVLALERKRPYVRFLANLLGFTGFAFIESLAFFDLFEVLSISFTSLLLAGIIIAVMVLLVVGPIIATRSKSDSIDKEIEEIYGVPPDAARMEVLVGLEISDEMARQIEEESEEDKKSHRRDALRKSAIVTVVIVPIAFIIVYVLGMNSSSPSVIWVALMMSIVVGGGVFVIAFMTALMWPMMTLGSGPRDTEWDVEYPFAEELQQFLNKERDYENLMVKGVKPPFGDQTGLVVLGLKPDYSEETLHAVLPHTLRDLQDVELIGPLILAELKKNEIEERERKIGFRALGIALPFLIIGMVWAVLTQGIYGILLYFIPIIIAYLVIAFIPMGYMLYWKRKELVKSEVEVAMKYPRYREALQILIKNHHSLPYGTTSYRKRLERLNKKLGIESHYPSDDTGLGIE